MPDIPKDIIQGKITNKSAAPIKGLTVKAFYLDSKPSEKPLGIPSQTDVNGYYKITYSNNDLNMGKTKQSEVNIILKFYDENKMILAKSNPFQNENQKITKSYQLNYPKEDNNQKTRLVYGRVTDKLNSSIANLIVQAFDQDMRHEELLGESSTDREGKYEITWSNSQLSGRGRKQADIAVKVFTRKKKTLLFSSDLDSVRFNASEREEINITINKHINPEVIEFDFIVKEIEFLAHKIAITDLQEDEKHRDITFLSKEMEISAEKIEHVVVAHRLSYISKIDPAFFYALLRKNTLLKNDLARAFSARLMVNINTEILPLIYDAALTDIKLIQRDVEAAVNDMIVDKKVAKQWRENVHGLNRYKSEAEKYYQNEHIQKVVSVITDFVLENKMDEIVDIFEQNKNDMDAFFNKMKDKSLFKSKVKTKQAETSMALAEVLGFDNVIISQIKESQKITKPEDVKKLARLNKAGWEDLLTETSRQLTIAGKPLNENLISLHASSLVRKMEKSYPTTAFSAQLTRAKTSVLKNHKDIAAFLTQHDDFDLQHSNIDLFMKNKKLAKKSIIQELKTVQRIFKLSPHYGKTTALLSKNIHSAQSITSLGKTRFIKEIAPEAGIKDAEAKTIFRKAEKKSAAAMLIAGELQDTLRSKDMPALEMKSLSRSLEAVSRDFPNLKSLFKQADICECKHCRSVYSPAAYLVEILQFLGNRSVTDLTVTPHVTTNLAKDILFKRRPDLGEIDLGCENANIPVPYIDLVCELLEEAIAPDTGIDFTGRLSDDADPLTGTVSSSLLTTLTDAGIPVTNKAQIYETETTIGNSSILPHYLRDKKAVCKIVNIAEDQYKIFRLRQTLSTAAELAATPEYINTNAYAALKNNAYAFTLPFDLDHIESAAYFNRFNIQRSQLMEIFQSADRPSDEAISAECLGFSDAEKKLVTTPNSGNQQHYWNTTSVVASDEVKVVDVFLNKSELTYKELNLLLNLKFIDPADNLFIKHLDLSCDTKQKEIANINDDDLDRIHRFLRLQKQTGCEFETLDQIIIQKNIGNGQLDAACLIKACLIKKISEKTGIQLNELIGFFGELPHEELIDDGPTPLYQKVFQNKATSGFVDENLSPHKVDGTQLLSAVKSSLALCLQLKEQDLDKLFLLLPDESLSFTNVSFLFASSRLIKKLKLSVDDYIILIQLTGIDIQNSPEMTLDFVEAVKLTKTSPIKLVDIQFMLRHEAENLTDREIKTDKITTLLQKLQKEFQEIFNTNKSAFDEYLSAEEQKETLQAALSRLPNIEADEVKTFIKFIDRDWESDTNAKMFIDNNLGCFFDTAAIKSSIDNLATVPDPDSLETDSDPETITAQRAAQSEAQKDLVKAFLDSIAAYQLSSGKRSILEQTLTKVFKANSEIVTIVLDLASVKQPAPGAGLIANLFQTDTLIDTINATPILPTITEAEFDDQFKAFRLLHKLFPLINLLKLTGQKLEWFLKNNKTLGWFELDSIPYETGQRSVDYSVFSTFIRIAELSNQLTPTPNPADVEFPITFLTLAEMLLPINATIRHDFLEAFSLLTGYDKVDLDAIDTHLFPEFSLINYADPDNWKQVTLCAEFLRKLDATVSQVVEYIKPVLTSTDVKLLRVALKARYDEDTWLTTLQEINDTIRPQKRDALTAYLMAVNSEMKEKSDLYDYFLVDVEMESCMPSSRIVQAHGAIQLFVQRCLMGLEPGAAADVTNDKSWEQWRWMKNYRVWEANRKVFLYPENWIEAELRDDKSFLFEDLENELLQNELTKFTAEDALIRYIEKMDNIAFLEVMATWYQSDIKTMHVFARTKGGDPAIYYYRKFEEERYWTPWEKVELDIAGDHLLAFVRNNRLNLAWPIFSDEPDPNPQSTIPDSTKGTVVYNDRPKTKLKIQLAISEYANGAWQPKKISKESLLTPSNFTNNEYILRRDIYNLLYFEWSKQICLFRTNINHGFNEYEHHQLIGIFNISGCKGYPELAFEGGPERLPDFLPDFKDTWLKSQRYNEMNLLPPDDLAVKNGIVFYDFLEILRKTPGQFRLSYPHQVTRIDDSALLFQYITEYIYGGNKKTKEARSIKFPFGTLLPYFKEDSNHAYVIIPGFYDIKKDGTSFVNRTVSNVLQLIEDMYALLKKYNLRSSENPDLNTFIQELTTDDDYRAILDELTVYNGLRYGEQFRNMYHPLICPLRITLYKDGISELMKRETQLQKTTFNFQNYYDPNIRIVPKTYVANIDGTNILTYPVEDLDFSSDGSYSGYNWELFFHIPFLMATQLTQNQRFEEALTWFHYIFNPTGALDGDAPQKYWITKPFFLTFNADYIKQRIDTLLYNIADPLTSERKDLEFTINQWRKKPFEPHVIARFRPVAYQKALLIKYIDNLFEWGDYLFRQDTMESLAQATQMYILADKLLGPKPRVIPPTSKVPYETYNQLEAKISSFGNVLVELENILPDLSSLPEGGEELPPAPITFSTLYFCIPQNEKMISYWDRIADRLFKIRNCQNIDGVERTLALFAPPIDPGMMVRAAASGLDMSSILSGMNAPVPYYRFHVLAQKATELTQEVRTLGSSLLQTLEKKDAELLALLRNELEIKILNAIKDMKTLQFEEAEEQIEVLKKTKAVTEERNQYYATIEKIITKEQLNLDKLGDAHFWQMLSKSGHATVAVLALIGDIAIGVAGFGGSALTTAMAGGSLLSTAATAASSVFDVLSTAASYEANRASILAGYDRRYDDWKLQDRLAKKELKQIDQQIVAAEIRKEIAKKDLENHDLQIDNAKKTDTFMRLKFTNKELYQWMVGQISAVYFKAYQMAHDFAKKAERSYRFELGNNDTFIAYGYWDSMKKGLQASDKLIHDIKRMETSYMDKNKREYEVTKHISLSMLDPLALVKLRATGECDFEVPEVLFDMDYPGQYFRRIKSVSLSLPCIVGPYTSVNAKLSLIKNKYRKNANPDNLETTGYSENSGNDERFVYNVGAIQSIATSNAQNDSGMFELSFRDERYLPFEGTGAVSSWRLELPNEIRQFNYNTISDVLLHLKYTAREGGSNLKSLAEASLKNQLNDLKQELKQTGLHLAINMKHDLTNEWHFLKKNGTVDVTITKSRLPYMAQTIVTSISNVVFIAKIKNNPESFTINVDAVDISLSRIKDWKLCQGNNTAIVLDTSFSLSVVAEQLPKLEELMMVVKYVF